MKKKTSKLPKISLKINLKFLGIALNKLKKVKNISYIGLILVLLGFWFYWTQVRVINIRRRCYSEVFTPTTQNAKWSKGKVWTLMYPAYDPARGNRYNYTFWGWGYPETDNEVNVYNRCLVWNGLVNTPEFK